METCRRICKECPWRRTSLKGWLGEMSGDPAGFAWHHLHGPVPLPCHLRVDWGHPEAQERARLAPVCRGFLTFLRNARIMPVNPEVARLRNRVPEDHGLIFSNFAEFQAHHHDEALARSFSSMRNSLV